jgi:hypothetical protein
MPRRRTSNRPLRRRIKLETPGDVLTEMVRATRQARNGDLPRTDAVKDVQMLDRVRTGLIEQGVSNAVNGIGSINFIITPIASGTYLSREAVNDLDGRLPDDAVIQLIEVGETPSARMTFSEAKTLVSTEAASPASLEQELTHLHSLDLPKDADDDDDDVVA